jgi:hypothetical protein
LGQDRAELQKISPPRVNVMETKFDHEPKGILVTGLCLGDKILLF